MKQNTVYKTKMPDFNIEGKTYAIRAFGGKFTMLYIEGKQWRSFMELISEIPYLEMPFIMNQFRENGVKIRDIISLCISEIKNGLYLPDHMVRRCQREIYYARTGKGPLKYERRFGLSKGMFEHAIRFINYANSELYTAVEAELLKTLPKCRTRRDLEEALQFEKFADDSPVLREILRISNARLATIHQNDS